jgi:hypothetical protein
MRNTLRTVIGTAAIGITAGFSLEAQTVREGARTSPGDAKIAFGYLCDDRFVVHNEGDGPVRLEYGLTRTDERTSLALEKDESIELLLSTSDELGLYSGGKEIAVARREYRDCDEVEGRSPRVVVRPLVVVAAPRVIVAPYPVYRAYYDPWYHHRSYPRTVVHTVIRIPIVINRRSSGSRDYGRDAGRNAGRNAGRDVGRDRGNGRRGR